MAKNDEKFEDPALDDDQLFSAAEIEKIKAKARAEILEAKREDMKKKILAEEKQRLRNEEGLTTGNAHSDEIVSVTIDLPLFSDKILINSVPYWHGRTYPVPRHVADTLRDQMYRSWEHQNTIEGKSRREAMAQAHVQDLYKPTTKGAILGKAN